MCDMLSELTGIWPLSSDDAAFGQWLSVRLSMNLDGTRVLEDRVLPLPRMQILYTYQHPSANFHLDTPELMF